MNRAWMYIGTIALGLWFSATSCNGLLADEYAEWPVNIWCWGLFAWYYRSGERKQRIEMLTVVALVIKALLTTCLNSEFSDKNLAIVGLFFSNNNFS